MVAVRSEVVEPTARSTPWFPSLLPEGLRPERRFPEIGQQVVDYLNSVTALNMWAITRVNTSSQLVLTTTEPTAEIPIAVGDVFDLSVTMCRHMISGAVPRIVPDTRAEPALTEAVAFTDSADLTVNSYVGTPIVRTDGALFGTLCGFGARKQDDSLQALEPLLNLLSALLSSVLDADSAAIEAARELEKARRESDVDSLTGLLNRRGWDRFIQHEEARFRRFGDPVSVVMLDLDRLKEINDTLGHDAGDDYLRRAARVLADTVRASDVVARLGGDEFGVIAVGADPQRAEVLMRRIEERLTAAGVSGSLGHAAFCVIAGFPDAQKAADEMMYEDKRRRRAVLRSEAVGTRS